MNFIDYVIKKTDKYNRYSFIGMSEQEKRMLLTLQVLNYRARFMREMFDKDLEIEIDTELDPGYFDRHLIDPHEQESK